MSKKPRCKTCGHIGVHPLTIDYSKCKITRAERRYFWRKIGKINKLIESDGGEK